ncbi:MAG: gamma carbonic anhydrase family protein [Chloroflexi bacterium]|jgi:carbonic anhydrase/acetyltransferase-like protein (isoleucine patch superfamily)|nr:gamma carbonic anhydrase family protein [Chloroflexota bacterium]
MPDEEIKNVLRPYIHSSVFIAKGAQIYGDVEIKEGASIWFNAVVRGDEGAIVIGKNTNIQDNAVIHSDGTIPVEIADNVTVGHCAVIRGCKIAKNVMVGMNATIMSGADIGEYCVIGANSFIPYNKKFPPKSLITGVPAKVIRELTDEETAINDVTPQLYEETIANYRKGIIVGYEDG